MKKFIEINGVSFEVEKPIEHEPTRGYTRLEDCYANPSTTKQEIWLDWVKFFAEASDYNFEAWVSSYNCMFFTITATATIKGQRYLFYITKCHNRVSLINI